MVFSMTTKSYIASSNGDNHSWVVINAEDVILGRLASRVATILRGKHKPEYTPHVDVGDYVVIVNAEKVKVSGNKLAQKTYYRHSGYPGGIKSRNLSELLIEHPTKAVESAVKGMLPRTKLGRQMFKKLKVYQGDSHPHTAQRPTNMEL